MSSKAVVTVLGSPQEVERQWKRESQRLQNVEGHEGAVEFRAAPGDRGTEIHVDLGASASGRGPVEFLKKPGSPTLAAKIKDDLRQFKALAETGVIPRSDGAPEGELAERKLKQRPAQPLTESEMKEVGV